MKSIQTWVIIGLVILLVISILTRPTKEITDIKPFQIQIAEQNLTIDSLSKSRTKLTRKMAEDSIIRAEEAIAHKQDVQKKNAVIAKLKANPTIVMVRDSIPVVDSLIIAQDSLIESQGKRIQVLEGDVKTLGIDLNQVTANFEAQLEAMRSKLKATEEIAGVYKKEARKAKRANRWLKAVIPVVGVGMFLLGQ